jgi:lipopolysaccharide transport system permease protein
MVLAPIYLALRDTMWVVTALMTVGFFASPVLYELDFLPSSIRFLAAWNPMAALIGFYRSLVLGVPGPETLSIVVLLAAVIGLWVAAVALMTRMEGRLDEYW